jgi:hypothetical protein
MSRDEVLKKLGTPKLIYDGERTNTLGAGGPPGTVSSVLWPY